MIYLASPYTNPDPKIVDERYKQTMWAMSLFLKQGVNLYSPIVHCHEVATRYQLPTDYLFWLKYNTHFLELSSGMFVLCLDGWKESKGIKEEILIAERLKLPTEYIGFNCGQLVYNFLI